MMKNFDYKQLYEEALLEISRLETENTYLKSKLNEIDASFDISESKPTEKNLQYSDESIDKEIVTKNSSSKEKLELFLSVFQAREDVCAVRWKNINSGKAGYSPYCKNEWRRGICYKAKGIKCKDCRHQDFYVLDKQTLKLHFLGKKVLGAYSLNKENLCKFIVIDLDKNNYLDEAKIIMATCKKYEISAYLERSRSGNGCHIWFFFDTWIKASLARKFMFVLLDKAMEESSLIDFSSYDRLLPNQDFIKNKGFGNLIALPFQGEAVKNGNSLFLDENFMPYDDQWLFLQSIVKLDENFIQDFIENYDISIVENSEEKPLEVMPSISDYPETLELKLSAGIIISKSELTAKGLLYLRKLASYFNPEFFSKQAMGMSTYQTPKMMVMYEENEKHIILPKMLLEQLLKHLDKNNISYKIISEESNRQKIDVSFNGTLRAEQITALNNLLSYNGGVLCAVPGFGKTVVAAKLICEKKVSSLILVHTKELANQWTKRLLEFIDINYEEVKVSKRKTAKIGKLLSGQNRLTGKIDVALMQSMFEKDKSVKDILDNYGLVIIDECHHVATKSFRAIMRNVKSKYIYGLTATPVRKDGHHPIIAMYCGDIRYEQTVQNIKENSRYRKIIIPRFTPCKKPAHLISYNAEFQKINSYICDNELRNQLIADDIRKMLKEKRKVLVLTDRISHLKKLAILLQDASNLIVLHGELSLKERNFVLDKINSLDKDKQIVIISIGKLVGEGFDLPYLDTLVLASPISWKGRIIQYAGRIHREADGKSELRIIDYIDIHFPMLEKMYFKRLKVYKSMGYDLKHSIHNLSLKDKLFFDDSYLEFIREDMKQTEKSLFISMPYLTKKKFESFKNELFNAYRRGIKIVVMLKPVREYNEKYKLFISKVQKELQNVGIEVINKKK